MKHYKDSPQPGPAPKPTDLATMILKSLEGVDWDDAEVKAIKNDRPLIEDIASVESMTFTIEPIVKE